MERLGQSVIGVDSRENGISGNGHSLYRQLLEFCCKRQQKKKKLRLWLLGDVGSSDFFFPHGRERWEVLQHVCIFLEVTPQNENVYHAGGRGKTVGALSLSNQTEDGIQCTKRGVGLR